MAPTLIAAGISAGGSLLAGQSAMAAGKFSQNVANKNAKILEGKSETALQIGQNNLKIAEKQYEKTQAATDVSLVAAGVKLDQGTPLEILNNNLSEFELQKLNIEYDANMTSYDFLMQATNERLRGEMAVYQARQQRAASFIKAAGTMVGAYATNNILQTQSANQAEILATTKRNAKILTDNYNNGQMNIINKINNMNKQIINLQNENNLAYANKFPGSY
tara:strand:- start:5302 stop:5961 length:660 start_codon:yes stop_codon:yes gene_type:complete